MRPATAKRASVPRGPDGLGTTQQQITVVTTDRPRAKIVACVVD